MSAAAIGEALLSLDGVGVRFGGVHALTDVSLTVGPEEIVGLIGPNGAGKTTLFDTITGVQAPTTGQLHYRGRSINRLSPTRRARMGMRRTFQRAQPFGWLSVEDNILVALGRDTDAGLFARGQDTRRRDRVREVIAQFGLEPVAQEAAGRLPIGTIRLVELARAVVSRPSLLLLDEPTSGLDHRETQLLGDVIERTRTDDHCAVMLVEHDVPFVMGRCDRVIALDLGRVLASGRPEELQADPAVRAAYLGAH